jgi:hypothetical protein
MYPTSFSQGRAITKSNTVNFTTALKNGFCDAIYVGGAGTMTVVFEDDSTQVFTVAVGDIVPVKVKRVNNSGTASLLVALYAV